MEITCPCLMVRPKSHLAGCADESFEFKSEQAFCGNPRMRFSALPTRWPERRAHSSPPSFFAVRVANQRKSDSVAPIGLSCRGAVPFGQLERHPSRMEKGALAGFCTASLALGPKRSTAAPGGLQSGELTCMGCAPAGEAPLPSADAA